MTPDSGMSALLQWAATHWYIWAIMWFAFLGYLLLTRGREA